MEGHLTYLNNQTGITYTETVNLVKDLSISNSKGFEHTTRDGHVKAYMVNIEIQGLNPGNIVQIKTIPNSWKMRNAFRKFHFYRNHMFENAGITKSEMGKYGQTIRPYMNKAHFDVAELAVSLDGVNAANGGEWTYSKFSSVPLYSTGSPDMGASTLKVFDDWPVSVLDENDVGTTETGTSGMFARVAMINSYNLDRMEVVTPDAAVTIDGPSNPLAALMAAGDQSAGRLLELAEDQELEKPPYDLTDGGDSTDEILVGSRRAGSLFTNLRWSGIVPAGLFQIYADQGAPIVDGTDNGRPSYLLNVEVVGEVLCKDLE